MALYVWDETALEWVTGASFPPSGAAGGDLAGTYPNPTVHDVSVLTTKGDLLGRGSSAPASRLAVGTDGQVLTADSASTLGVKWATGSGGGVTSLDSITGAVSLVAGSNVTITDNSPSAGDITIAASGGSGGMTLLYSSVLASAGTFDTGASGIAAGFHSLYVVAYLRRNDAVTSGGTSIQFNGDTGAHYDVAEMRNNNGTLSAPAIFAQTSATVCIIPGASATANYFAAVRMVIPMYGVTTGGFKNGDTSGGFATDASTNIQQFNGAFTWRSTAAINQIAFTNTFATGSSVYIYGTP